MKDAFWFPHANNWLLPGTNENQILSVIISNNNKTYIAPISISLLQLMLTLGAR